MPWLDVRFDCVCMIGPDPESESATDCCLNGNVPTSPQLGDKVSLAIRKSDNVDREGVALVQGDTFMGRVKQGDIGFVQLLMAEHSLLSGEIAQVEHYEWHDGGGLCTRGALRVSCLLVRVSGPLRKPTLLKMRR